MCLNPRLVKIPREVTRMCPKNQQWANAKGGSHPCIFIQVCWKFPFSSLCFAKCVNIVTLLILQHHLLWHVFLQNVFEKCFSYAQLGYCHLLKLHKIYKYAYLTPLAGIFLKKWPFKKHLDEVARRGSQWELMYNQLIVSLQSEHGQGAERKESTQTQI